MISKCINLQTISNYLAGSLNEQAVSEVETHLANCYRCREELVLSQDILADPDLTRGSVISENEALSIIENLNFSPGLVETCQEGIQSIKENTQKYWQKFKDQLSPGFSSNLAFAPVRVRSSAQKDQSSKRLTVPICNHRIESIITPAENGCCHLNLQIFHEKSLAQNCRITLTDPENRTSSRPGNVGEIQFENIPCGECHLSLFQNGSPVGETKIYTGSFA